MKSLSVIAICAVVTAACSAPSNVTATGPTTSPSSAESGLVDTIGGLSLQLEPEKWHVLERNEEYVGLQRDLTPDCPDSECPALLVYTHPHPYYQHYVQGDEFVDTLNECEMGTSAFQPAIYSGPTVVGGEAAKLYISKPCPGKKDRIRQNWLVPSRRLLIQEVADFEGRTIENLKEILERAEWR